MCTKATDHAEIRQTPASRTKSFFVAPVKLHDVRRIVDIEFHAFENERVNQALSFRDYKKPAHFERAVGIYKSALSNAISTCAIDVSSTGRLDSEAELPLPINSVMLKKAVDLATNEIASFTKFETKAYTEQELCIPADRGHEGEPRMNRDWFALNERTRREYMDQREHCYVAMLATEPKYQHNGAGTMLLEDIVAEADRAGVEIYLEATDSAKPFYEKHAFEAVTELRFDPAEYGLKGLGIERQTVMVRGALRTDGSRNAVRRWPVAAPNARM